MPALDQRLLDAIERLGQGRRAFLQGIATQRRVSPLQIDVVVLLGAGVTPPVAGEVARHLDVAASTVADAVATLRLKGLVSEEPDPLDGRRKLLVLTAAGRALADAMGQERDVLSAALVGLDPAAKAATLDVVLTLIGDLHASGVISVDRSCKSCRFRDERAGATDWCRVLSRELTADVLRVSCPEHESRLTLSAGR